MTPEQTALARRLVASPHWRWVEGARDLGDALFVGISGGYRHWVVDGMLVASEPDFPLAPDLNDPATIGIIEHLAREAWGDAGSGLWLLHCGIGTEPWQVWSEGRGCPLVYAPCRGSAWAEALLAAPSTS